MQRYRFGLYKLGRIYLYKDHQDNVPVSRTPKREGQTIFIKGEAAAFFP